ncbi:hypothetical protein [Clostridium sp.]|uniref:hypothetical protein n=1 Tax=Clostridium sp. TaxID=1506 RepID=UPI00284AD351|nr:hypothetical protein [Clostridium sp.]MDR3597558.1 hypothetical protein [Clostridium sp.]
MNRGIVFFATDDEKIIKDVEDKIAVAKNECNIIKDTSKAIIEHLFNMIDKNMNEEKNFECDFEKGFYQIYNENISTEISELNVNNLLDEILSTITTHNTNFQVEHEITLPNSYKIRINKTVFNSFLKYVFVYSINSNDNYIMKINGGINYVVNKEIVHFIVNIADKTNEKSILNSSMNKLTQERIDFINVFMNHLLEPCNGKFRLNKIDAKLMIEIHLIKNVTK